MTHPRAVKGGFIRCTTRAPLPPHVSFPVRRANHRMADNGVNPCGRSSAMFLIITWISLLSSPVCG
jgi:hypothetical protein